VERIMKRKKDIMLYTLSTCIWCKRMKRFLNELGIEYRYIDVDLLSRNEAREVQDTIDSLPANGGFPIMVIDNKEVICGFDEDRIRNALL
jgi:glutaredoxin-like protein NrdH